MSRPLRVLHQIHLAHDAWGGMEKQFANLLNATAQDQRIAHYLSEDMRDVAPGVAAALPGLQAPPNDARRWHGMTVPNWRGMRQSRQASQARNWGIDIVLSWNRFSDPRPVRLATRIGAASVYWERGAAWYARSRAPDTDFLQGFDGVIANSQACAAMLRYWGVTAPVEICRPGIYSPTAAIARAAPRTPLRLGFCAPLQTFKGGVLAVHTLAALRRRGFAATLTIAGEGPDREKMQQVAQQLGIDDLQFLGRLTEMDAFYADIDLLLHPALREPYGNACAEALIAGVPVVATDVDGIPEVVDHAVDGLCVAPTLSLDEYRQFGGDPDAVYPRVWRPDLNRVAEPGVPDPERLADAVLQIASDPQRYALCSAAAVKSAHERFDYSAHLTRLFELLHRASDARKTARLVPGKAYNCVDQTRPTWQDRADKAAQLVIDLLEGHTATRRVADLGCGDCKLRTALAQLGTACEYRGYDLLPQSADVAALDLARDRLPQSCDVAVMLGVSEYLESLPDTLQRLRLDAAALVVSHTLGDRPRSAEELQRLGWRNHLSRADFEKTLLQAGWIVRDQRITDDGKTRLWSCVRQG
jgi:glycosyltransferase involved in cell wall biosynthesis